MRVTAVPGEDVVVLQIADGPALTLHPETARDLMLAQQSEIKRSRSRGGADQPGPNEVTVPAQLQWRGLEQSAAVRGKTRGFLGDVLLSAVQVITGAATGGAADFVAAKAVQHVDDQVTAGVYALSSESLPPLKGKGTPLKQAPAAPDGGPLLVFVHGTFSDTSGTFAKLWTQHPQRVRTLFAKYGDRVYALDHPTLGVSPIANALTLAQRAAEGARLHLVTHSRGGLVAEVLARVCANPDDRRPTTRLLRRRPGTRRSATLDDTGRRSCKQPRHSCRAHRPRRVPGTRHAARVEAARRLPVGLQVDARAGGHPGRARAAWTSWPRSRNAAPSRARFPASRRRFPTARSCSGCTRPTTADRRASCAWSPATSRAIRSTSWLKTLLADAFYWTDNDLVVQTRSMYGGAPRDGGRDASCSTRAARSRTSTTSATSARPRRSSNALLARRSRTASATIGPLSWAGESSTGVARRCARAAGDGAAGERQAGGVRVAGHSRQQPQGRRQAHLARLAPRSTA